MAASFRDAASSAAHSPSPSRRNSDAFRVFSPKHQGDTRDGRGASPRDERGEGGPLDAFRQRWGLSRMFAPKCVLLILPDGSCKMYSEALSVAEVQREFPRHDVGSLTTSRSCLAPDKVLHPGSTYYLTRRTCCTHCPNAHSHSPSPSRSRSRSRPNNATHSPAQSQSCSHSPRTSLCLDPDEADAVRLPALRRLQGARSLSPHVDPCSHPTFNRESCPHSERPDLDRGLLPQDAASAAASHHEGPSNAEAGHRGPHRRRSRDFRRSSSMPRRVIVPGNGPSERTGLIRVASAHEDPVHVARLGPVRGPRSGQFPPSNDVEYVLRYDGADDTFSPSQDVRRIVITRAGSDVEHNPGPSLRPQPGAGTRGSMTRAASDSGPGLERVTVVPLPRGLRAHSPSPLASSASSPAWQIAHYADLITSPTQSSPPFSSPNVSSPQAPSSHPHLPHSSSQASSSQASSPRLDTALARSPGSSADFSPGPLCSSDSGSFSLSPQSMGSPGGDPSQAQVLLCLTPTFLREPRPSRFKAKCKAD